MKIGEKVKNGSIVVAEKRTFTGKEIILCLWNELTPYVTWNCYNGNCENGHYHCSLDSAPEDFNSRI